MVKKGFAISASQIVTITHRWMDLTSLPSTLLHEDLTAIKLVADRQKASQNLSIFYNWNFNKAEQKAVV